MSRTLYRAAAVLTAIFAAGHSMGTFSAPKGAQVPVAAVMKNVSFDLFGSPRTYWDMFHGYGVLFIFVAVFLAVLLWMLSLQPGPQARPVALLTAALQVAIAVVSFTSFFWAPALLNAASAACTFAAAARA